MTFYLSSLSCICGISDTLLLNLFQQQKVDFADCGRDPIILARHDEGRVSCPVS